jgi:hypothetical protein
MPDVLLDPPARGGLAIRMTQLTGAPVTAVARINVVWLDTLRGFSVIIAAGAFVRQLMGGSPATLWITLASVCVFQGLAWVGLRHLGRPLQLGLGGGVAAVSGPTLYIAASNWITGRPTKMLGSWPRDAVVLRHVSRIGLRRLLSVKFPSTDAPARLEVVGRRKDATIGDLFGPVRDVSL